MTDHEAALRDNQALWDAWTRIHEASEFYDLEGFKRGGIRLRPYEVDEVGPVEGKDLLHVQCHFGIDTLSWARLGARVTGADFSDAAVGLARSIAAEIGIENARFVRSSVYDLPENLKGEFDIVYTSRGVLGWLPDIRRWAENKTPGALDWPNYEGIAPIFRQYTPVQCYPIPDQELSTNPNLAAK